MDVSTQADFAVGYKDVEVVEDEEGEDGEGGDGGVEVEEG